MLSKRFETLDVIEQVRPVLQGVSGEKLVVDMQTPRVVHKFGQPIYFCCWGCINHFWTDPASAFAW